MFAFPRIHSAVALQSEAQLKGFCSTFCLSCDYNICLAVNMLRRGKMRSSHLQTFQAKIYEDATWQHYEFMLCMSEQPTRATIKSSLIKYFSLGNFHNFFLIKLWDFNVMIYIRHSDLKCWSSCHKKRSIFVSRFRS